MFEFLRKSKLKIFLGYPFVRDFLKETSNLGPFLENLGGFENELITKHGFGRAQIVRIRRVAEIFSSANFKVKPISRTSLKDGQANYDPLSATVMLGDQNPGYYRGLKAFVTPILNRARTGYSGQFKIADFGGGSGIVGTAVLRWLLKWGYNAYLTVVDFNPDNLAQVPAEARKVGVPPNRVGTLQSDLVSVRFRDMLDGITTRAVLHYNPKSKYLPILSKINESLRVGGVYTGLEMAAPDRSLARFMNKFYNKADDFLIGKKHPKRWYPTQAKLASLMKRAGLKVEFTLDHSLKPPTPPANDTRIYIPNRLGIKEDWQLTEIENLLLGANDHIKSAFRIKEAGKRGVTYDWHHLRFVARKI